VKKDNKPVVCKSNPASEKSWQFLHPEILTAFFSSVVDCIWKQEREVHSWTLKHHMICGGKSWCQQLKKKEKKCTKNSVFISRFYLFVSKSWKVYIDVYNQFYVEEGNLCKIELICHI
jgi:hypothetical protein